MLTAPIVLSRREFLMTELGRITEVNLRNQWSREEEFTSWLSDHLDNLSDELDLDLELIDTEVIVGEAFRADILAQPIPEEVGDVIIENQFRKSDHAHLGKIITYGAGLDASYVIWICEPLRDEHRTAIDWLNENSGETTGYLALEIKLLRIDDSNPAPAFEVISKPDEWGKSVRREARGRLTPTKELQKKFWDNFKSYMEERGTSLSLRKTYPRHWYSFAVGRVGFKISLTVNTRENKVGCELYISKKVLRESGL